MSARDAAKIPKRIDSIRFTLMDPNEIRKMSSEIGRASCRERVCGSV